jgi:hypothetical protein
MTEEYVEEFLKKVEDGLLEAQKKMLHEYALHDDSVVIGDADGNVLHVPAKEILEKHPELRM